MRRSVSTKPKAGEVWFADLGMIEKGRPVLVLYYPLREDARALAIVAPLTSQIRGQRGEIDLGYPKWLPKPSAVNVQGLASFDRNILTRRFGKLTQNQMDEVKDAIRDLLEI
jgi:mRNA-degrading endonuclease toxin of MazEF toxin-antitoxin module